MRKVLLVLFASHSAACFFDTSGTVPFAEADGGATDGGENNTNGLFTRDSLTRGTTCSGAPTAPADLACNPVLQDCPDGQICEILARPFRTGCKAPDDDETFELMDGAPCVAGVTNERCRLGAYCLAGECRALCEFDGAFGCPDNMFCETFASDPPPGDRFLAGYGACFEGCWE